MRLLDTATRSRKVVRACVGHWCGYYSASSLPSQCQPHWPRCSHCFSLLRHLQVWKICEVRLVSVPVILYSNSFAAQNVSVVNYSPALPLLRGINANVSDRCVVISDADTCQKQIYTYPTLSDAVNSLLNGSTMFLLVSLLFSIDANRTERITCTFFSTINHRYCNTTPQRGTFNPMARHSSTSTSCSASVLVSVLRRLTRSISPYFNCNKTRALLFNRLLTRTSTPLLRWSTFPRVKRDYSLTSRWSYAARSLASICCSSVFGHSLNTADTRTEAGARRKTPFKVPSKNKASE